MTKNAWPMTVCICRNKADRKDDCDLELLCKMRATQTVIAPEILQEIFDSPIPWNDDKEEQIAKVRPLQAGTGMH
jgi:hypothetical protein